MADRVTCPNCAGRGTFGAFAVGADGRDRYVPDKPCHLCIAEGTVTAEAARWHAEGRRARRARILRLESLAECAERLGLSPQEVNAMETGRADPRRLLAEQGRAA